MRSAAVKLLGLAVGVGALVVGLADPVKADHVLVEVSAPTQATVGERAEIEVTLWSEDDDSPLGDATVTVSREAAFGGVSGKVELARGVTDSDGSAVLGYLERSSGAHEIVIEYVGPGESEPEAVSIAITATAQLYRSDTGIDIPGLSGWLIIGLIAGVWGIMLYAVLLVVAVARAGSDTAVTAGASSVESMPAWATSSGLGAAGTRFRNLRFLAPAVLTVTVGSLALTLIAVLMRNPVTHANLAGPEGYVRTEHAHVGEELPYEGLGVSNRAEGATGDPVEDGRNLYVRAGCVSCHGLGGTGAVVGDDLDSVRKDELSEFIRNIRRGPKGMPAYSEEILSDEDLRAIYEFLALVAGESQ